MKIQILQGNLEIILHNLPIFFLKKKEMGPMRENNLDF